MNDEEYKVAQQRLVVGEQRIMEKGGFLNAPKAWVNAFQKIAEDCLMYEIEHDLLPL